MSKIVIYPLSSSNLRGKKGNHIQMYLRSTSSSSVT